MRVVAQSPALTESETYFIITVSHIIGLFQTFKNQSLEFFELGFRESQAWRVDSFRLEVLQLVQVMVYLGCPCSCCCFKTLNGLRADGLRLGAKNT